ncbi:microtubule integrity protein mal3 [Elasticomyces elasticus]|nr:microtubule integrity protein mal3 [Elasticomyces elasticus]
MSTARSTVEQLVKCKMGARRPAGGVAASAPRTTSRQAGAGGGQASTLLQQNNAELMETVQGLERERDFYFLKLWDIEFLLKQIQATLYSREVGFEILAEVEGKAAAEEETF